MLRPPKESSSPSILIDGLKAAFYKNADLRETIQTLEETIKRYEVEMKRLKERLDGS